MARLGHGRILLAATPLGNPADASDRLRRALATCDVIAAEDTRRIRRLMADLELSTSADIVAVHEHNEADRTRALITRAIDGAVIVLVSDAGMPTISDPGYRLVNAAIEANVPISILPGPSAVTAALAVSGLPTDRFTFEGFLPKRPGRLATALAELSSERRTMVFFESPRRVAGTLASMIEVFGEERPAALCRELTKTYEEVRRGTLASLLAEATQQPVLGEVTLVVGGAPKAATVDLSDLVDAVEQLRASGLATKEAVAQVAVGAGVPKRTVYDAVVARRTGQPNVDSP